MSREQSLGKRAAAWVVDHRITVLIITLLIVIPLTVCLLHLDINNSSDIWFEEGNEYFGDYLAFLEEFGSDNVVVVACLFPDPFSAEGLSRLADITDKAAKIDNVLYAGSLVNVPVPRKAGLLVKPGTLLDPPPASEQERQALLKKLFSRKLVRTQLVSTDGRIPFLIIKVNPLDIKNKRRFLADIQSLLSRYGSENFRLAGIPLLDAEFDRMSTQENRIFIPVSITLVMIVILVLFRSMRVMLVCGIMVFTGLGVTIGIFSAADRTFNLMTSLVPPLLVAIGIADTVHLLHQYAEELGLGASPRTALVDAMGKMFRPCLFTSVTTSVGFLSLMVADIRPVREAGLFGAMGIMCAFLLSFTTFPALVTFLPSSVFLRRAKKGFARSPDRFDKGLTFLMGTVSRTRWVILIFSALLAAGAVWGVTRLTPETFVLNFFKESNTVRRDWAFLEDNGVGVASAQLVLAGKPGEFTSGKGLAQLSEIQAAAAEFDEVRLTVSIVDYLDQARDLVGLKGDAAALFPAILVSKAFQETGVRDSFLSKDGARARISLRLKGMSDRENLSFIRRLRAMLAERFSSSLRYTVTGAVVAFSLLNQVLVNSQEKTAATAVIAVCLAMIILLRSPLLALTGMVPNLLPILLTLGMMGWLKIPLDVGTMIIAGVSLGIAVDDTIHYLARFRRESEEGGSSSAVLVICHTTVGKALVFTSVILFAGFIVIGLSSFRPVYTFGLLTGLTMVFALIGDLVVLPAMLLVLPRWMTGWKPGEGETG